MPITDLTGTTWSFIGKLEQGGLTSGSHSYYVDFEADINGVSIYTTDTGTTRNRFVIYIANDTVGSFSFPAYTPSYDCRVINYYYSTADPLYWRYITQSTGNTTILGENAVLTIKFTGGTDVTNTEFINWVQANATLISPSVMDITGYTWVANDGTLKMSTNSYSINFTSNNQNFTSLVLTRQTSLIRYISYDNLQVYEVNLSAQNAGTWVADAYKTIQITGGEGATNLALIAWLEANGTLTAPQPTLTSPSIGNKDIVDMFVGDKQVKSMWLGNTKIYEGGAIEYTQDNDILTINNAPYSLNGDILTIGE